MLYLSSPHPLSLYLSLSHTHPHTYTPSHTPPHTYTLCLQMTALGDMFFQCWCYQYTLPTHHTPPIPEGYHIWLSDAWKQEQVLKLMCRTCQVYLHILVSPQQLIRHREISAGLGARTFDFGPLLDCKKQSGQIIYVTVWG